ncbi:hypothetical protein E2C01_033344 [Portunus trituberculatus]|uniref:Uncharacterized protein n=1 Tax=Portunus trituberculatus TaxID=210409 RepID=A0A5B7F270_PORTR|nr:hypothetical protein [Portunus trituberculatus]
MRRSEGRRGWASQCDGRGVVRTLSVKQILVRPCLPVSNHHLHPPLQVATGGVVFDALQAVPPHRPRESHRPLSPLKRHYPLEQNAAKPYPSI